MINGLHCHSVTAACSGLTATSVEDASSHRKLLSMLMLHQQQHCPVAGPLGLSIYNNHHPAAATLPFSLWWCNRMQPRSTLFQCAD